MIIPPFAGVVLVDYQDRIGLTPIYWCREFVGLGRFKADTVGPKPTDETYPLFNMVMGDGYIWVVTSWERYENGQEQAIDITYLDPETTEEEARKVFDKSVSFLRLDKGELEALSELFEVPEADRDYIANRFPDVEGPPAPTSIEEYDLYQARLKVLVGMQPKTVALIEQADTTHDPQKRRELEIEAVQAFFAEMAHFWTKAQVLEWQRSNPLGTEWMCEFADVLNNPKRELDSVNHELVLNWLRAKYNLLTTAIPQGN